MSKENMTNTRIVFFAIVAIAAMIVVLSTMFKQDKGAGPSGTN